ncbi:MAG: hypothetical protein VW547_07325 [Alphaproteobacteria bacterium]
MGQDAGRGVDRGVDTLQPYPHARAVGGPFRQQRRGGRDVLKVLHDDGGFEDDLVAAARIVDQRRHHGAGVKLHVVRVELFTLAKIERPAFPREALFRKDQPHLDRADRRGAVIEDEHRRPLWVCRSKV